MLKSWIKYASIFLAALVVIVIALVYIFPEGKDICDNTDYPYYEQCHHHSVVVYALYRAFTFLDVHNWILSTLATFAIAIITGFLAWYTAKLWGSAENATRLELRAYISVGEEPKGRILEEGKVPEFMPIVVNKGKTPAKGLYCVSWISILPKGIRKKSQLPKPKSKRIRSKGDLGAGDPSEYICKGTFTLTKEDLANISGWGDTRLYFYGTVYYRDIFTKKHHTDFCFQIQVRENGTVTGWHISPCHNGSN